MLLYCQGSSLHLVDGVARAHHKIDQTTPMISRTRTTYANSPSQ
jgi:hypothetical protein